MRYVVLILGLLGVAASGFYGYRWMSDPGNTPQLRDVAQKALEEFDKTGQPDNEFTKVFREVVVRHKAWPFLLAGAGLGLIASFLAFARKGLLAALLFVIGPVGAAVFHPASLILTSPLILAAILSLFVRKRAHA